ncbi:retrovirus-related pol polyprotein from transposon TNT 1-94 [Tanacetum coccineum]
MDTPTIPVSVDSSEGNFRDVIDIGLDVVHPVPVATDAFPALTIVTILASHGEAIRGIHEYLQGVTIEEEMSTLSFRMGMAEAENASLRGKIRTMEAIETVTRSQERRTRKEMERQLALVQESHLDRSIDSDKYLEGQSMQRPPLFESDSFIYCKNRFERALHPKWRAKVTAFEESKDLTSLSLDELIGNIKIHGMIIKKDSEIVKAKGERKSLALKAKKVSSDEECLTSGSEDEEHAMAVRDFKKFFKRKGRCGDPNHLIGECLKPPKDKNQRAFVGDSWSDSGEEDDEKAKDETTLKFPLLIKDSRRSKHMTGNRKLFSTYKAYNGGNVIFGSNLRGNIIAKGTISYGSLKIANVEHVDNLGLNLLSIGQICDSKCKVIFSENDSEIVKEGKVIGRGIRKKGLYVMKLGTKPEDKIYLATIDENSTLWHRRLGHANMHLIQSLASKELVRNLPKLKFD